LVLGCQRSIPKYKKNSPLKIWKNQNQNIKQIIVMVIENSIKDLHLKNLEKFVLKKEFKKYFL